MAAIGKSAEQDLIFSATAGDARADRNRREISVGTQTVTIWRRVRGIEMRLSLAVSAYRGVALCLQPSGSYQVRLVHRDNDLCVALDEAATDHDIIADWRLWARVLGLPALVERALGSYEAAEGSVVAIAVEASSRRKRALKRRPRFLVRRTGGDISRMGQVYCDEREIIARH